MPIGAISDVTVVRGRDTEEQAEHWLRALAAERSEVVVDLGTGDGKHVLRVARARPEALVIGVDAVAEAMAGSASRAASKPSRGGLGNAIFVRASLERLPAAFDALATEVSVNFPWGSLLRAVGAPEREGMATLARVLRGGGTLTALLNADAAEQERHAQRLDLPPLEDVEHVRSQLVPGWEEAGFEEVAWRVLGAGEQPPVRTTWGQRLVRGSGRSTLLVTGRRRSESTAS